MKKAIYTVLILSLVFASCTKLKEDKEKPGVGEGSSKIDIVRSIVTVTYKYETIDSENKNFYNMIVRYKHYNSIKYDVFTIRKSDDICINKYSFTDLKPADVSIISDSIK